MAQPMSDDQRRLAELWAEHVKDEFATKDVEATLVTMVPDAYVNHVPVMTGGAGQDVRFRDGKLAHEHIYWDQASVLVQLGLLDASRLPVAGAETVLKVGDPSRPSNALMAR